MLHPLFRLERKNMNFSVLQYFRLPVTKPFSWVIIIKIFTAESWWEWNRGSFLTEANSIRRIHTVFNKMITEIKVKLSSGALKRQKVVLNCKWKKCVFFKCSTLEKFWWSYFNVRDKSLLCLKQVREIIPINLNNNNCSVHTYDSGNIMYFLLNIWGNLRLFLCLFSTTIKIIFHSNHDMENNKQDLTCRRGWQKVYNFFFFNPQCRIILKKVTS